ATVRRPPGGIPAAMPAAKAEPIVESVLRALTSRPAAGDAAVTSRGAGTPVGDVDAPEDLDQFQIWLMERGWGDGLPAIPPTRERVAAMLAGTRRKREEEVAILVPRLGRATVEAVAANAVMAGALRAHLAGILGRPAGS